jgi:hypothetical protein
MLDPGFVHQGRQMWFASAAMAHLNSRSRSDATASPGVSTDPRHGLTAPVAARLGSAGSHPYDARFCGKMPEFRPQAGLGNAVRIEWLPSDVPPHEQEKQCPL